MCSCTAAIMRFRRERIQVSATPTPGLADRWIRSRLARTVAEVARQFERYRFDLAAQALYEFTWHEFCDWYVELSKATLYADDAAPGDKAAAMTTLVEVLEALLRALHPIMPFITEEIWLRVASRAGAEGDSICDTRWPEAGDVDTDAERELGWVQQFVLGVRQIRGEMDIAPGKPLTVLLKSASADDVALLQAHRPLVARMANIETVQVLADGEDAPPSATALHGEMRIHVPMAGLIDVSKELDRLARQLERSQTDLARTKAKLENPKFVDRAPAEVVATERERAEEHAQTIARLEAQIAELGALDG